MNLFHPLSVEEPFFTSLKEDSLTAKIDNEQRESLAREWMDQNFKIGVVFSTLQASSVLNFECSCWLQFFYDVVLAILIGHN